MMLETLEGNPEGGAYQFGPFLLDVPRLRLFDRGERVALGPKVVETLLALIEQPGEVVSKNALLDRIWPDEDVNEASLAQNIHVLRREFRKRWGVAAIDTVPGRGYSFSGAVRRVDHVELAPERARYRVSRRLLLRSVAAVAATVLAVVTVTVAIVHAHQSSERTASDRQAARLDAIGRYYWDLRTRTAVARSMRYFTQAIDTDPQDSQGYAGLALANAVTGYQGYGPGSSLVYIARARAFARKAIELDPNSSDAYAVLGATESSRARLQRAIALDPKSAIAREWYGTFLLEHGDIRGSYRELRRASELDPLSVAVVVDLSNAAYLLGRYPEAISYARQALELSPKLEAAYEVLGVAYEQEGEAAEAIDAFRQIAQICPSCRPQAAVLLASAYAKTGRLSRARTMLAMAQAHAHDIATDDLAAALAAVGRRSDALALLKRLHGEYQGYVSTEIAADPRFARLRVVSGVSDRSI